jgi:hypothetical protein
VGTARARSSCKVLDGPSRPSDPGTRSRSTADPLAADTFERAEQTLELEAPQLALDPTRQCDCGSAFERRRSGGKLPASKSRWLNKCILSDGKDPKPLPIPANALTALENDQGLRDAFGYDEMLRVPTLLLPFGEGLPGFKSAINGARRRSTLISHIAKLERSTSEAAA